jgi:hypothetical protein
MTDDPLHPIRNVALLIDADNASPDTLDPVLTVLAELGTVNIRRAYGNWEKPGLKGWAKIVHLHAIEPHQQFDVTKGKSATDMKMVIDAMDLIYGGRVGGFGIMSSDSDFMPLAMRIRQDGLPVYGFGTAKTPLSFQNACSRFIEVGALKAANIASASDTGGAEARPVDEDLIKILGDAWKSSKRDEYGFASLREVGKLAGNRSSFDARSYGYASLSDLIQAIPNFQVDRGKDGETIVRRVR